jgi:hypothetical protein
MQRAEALHFSVDVSVQLFYVYLRDLVLSLYFELIFKANQVVEELSELSARLLAEP